MASPTKVVWKYVLDKRGGEIEIPRGARFLTGAFSEKQWVTWWEVDPEAEKGRRKFERAGTGWEIPVELVWRATGIDGETKSVWHLYEEDPIFRGR